MNDWMLIVLVFVVEALLHYFPWRQYLKGNELPRPLAYGLGVAGMMLPFSAWLYHRGEVEVITRLWLVIVAAGVAVLAAYGADAVKDMYWQQREYEEREEERRRHA